MLFVAPNKSIVTSPKKLFHNIMMGVINIDVCSRRYFCQQWLYKLNNVDPLHQNQQLCVLDIQ